MRPSQELIAGTTSAEALRGAGNVVQAFLETLARGTKDSTCMQELHRALLALPADAQSAQYAEVLRALESAQPVQVERAATGDAVAQLLEKEPELSSAPSASEPLSPQEQGVLHLLKTAFASGELPSSDFLNRCSAVGMQSLALAALQKYRLGMEDGPLFQALSDAYGSEAGNQPSRASLQARLRILDLAAAMYDSKDDRRNVGWVNGTILAFGRRLFAPEDGASPHNNQALQQATQAIEQRLIRRQESPALFDELCAEAERAWEAYGITCQGMQRKGC